MAAARSLDPRRRALEGKVFVARKEMCLDEHSYRGLMLRETGKASLTDCTDAEVVKLVDAFKAMGWQAQPKSEASARRFASGSKRLADHAPARKARALWISLGQLGAIENDSEAALEAFARRQLGCTAMQWADQSLMYRLIEALNAIALRHGWQPKHKNLKVVKARLATAILAKLKEKGFAAENWSLPTAAERIADIVPATRNVPEWWEMGDLEAVIAKFARLLKTGRKD